MCVFFFFFWIFPVFPSSGRDASRVLLSRSHPLPFSPSGGKHKRKGKRIIDNRWTWWSLHIRDSIDKKLTVPNKSCNLDNVIWVGDGSMGMKSITPPTWSNRKRISSMKWSQGNNKETAAHRARLKYLAEANRVLQCWPREQRERDRETGILYFFFLLPKRGCAPKCPSKCPKYYWCIANINNNNSRIYTHTHTHNVITRYILDVRSFPL